MPSHRIVSYVEAEWMKYDELNGMDILLVCVMKTLMTVTTE